MINLNISPRSEVLSILTPLPGRMQGRILLASNNTLMKVERVSSILHQNPNLEIDLPILKGILDFTENNGDEKIQKFRRDSIIRYLPKENHIRKITIDLPLQADELELCLGSLKESEGIFNVKNRTLSIASGVLKQYNADQFWNDIKKLNVNELIIQHDGESITYNKILILQFHDSKPSLQFLTEKFAVELKFGEKFTETKAKFMLCGGYFKRMFSNPLLENKTNFVVLKEISLKGFCGILERVETGRLDPELFDEEYLFTADYLDFNPYVAFSDLPPKTIGPSQWLELDNTIKVPPLPHHIQEILDSPCSFNRNTKVKETQRLALVVETVKGKSLTIDHISKLMGPSAHMINDVYKGQGSLSKDSKDLVTMIDEGPIPKAHWMLMTIDPVPGSYKLTYDKVEEFIKNKDPNYHLVSTRDVIIVTLMALLDNSQSRLFSPGWGPSTTFTHASQSRKNLNVVVGNFGAWGLEVKKVNEVEERHKGYIGACAARYFS